MDGSSSGADSGALAGAILDMSRHFREFPPDELAAHARDVYGHEAVARRWTETYAEVFFMYLRA